MQSNAHYGNWQREIQVEFKDFPRFVQSLQGAVNDEASAVDFYGRLLHQAKDATQQKSIEHVYLDEQRHLRMLQHMYRRLVGRDTPVKISRVDFTSYKEGIQLAFYGELDGAETYRNLFLQTRIPYIRDVLFRTMTDEMEHAQRFNFIYSGL
ncbi:ferritin-like domain-containing protein [Alicyclobacillus tolerans]|uniref:ferritin-like domain-containing protein n=1 Tax=Alicyclobacillus tolerans TaxID=90970 RepID=UPI001F1E68DB|nr:ferritin-like domain-containing protein [Alicyclobacillus tolerans]MCF8563409.1 ferritin-like domain-containing protein [Alicyclobacillus tolerans]